MLDNFCRTHRLARIKAYWREKKPHYNLDSNCPGEIYAEILTQQYRETKNRIENNKNVARFKKAHSLVDIRNIIKAKRSNSINLKDKRI